MQQLCLAGYTEEESIDAVERFETLERAMDYLMLAGLGGEEEMVGGGGAHYVEPLDPQ